MRVWWFDKAVGTALAGAVALLAAGAAPREERAGPLRIAYLSVEDAAADADRLDDLARTLARFGIDPAHVEVEHHRIPVEKSGEEVERFLAHPAPPFSLVMAMTMTLAEAASKFSVATPIVFDGASDPRRSCLVDTMARPGGRATGFTSDIAAEPKMLEALVDAFPSITRVVVLVDENELEISPCGSGLVARADPSTPCRTRLDAPGPEHDPVIHTNETRAAAQARHVALGYLYLCDAKSLAELASFLVDHGTVGVLVPLHSLFYAERLSLVRTLTALRLPVIYPRKYFLDAGGALALSPSRDGQGTRSFEIAAQVLRGRLPATIPVETPIGFELTINVAGAQQASLRPSPFALRQARSFLP